MSAPNIPPSNVVNLATMADWKLTPLEYVSVKFGSPSPTPNQYDIYRLLKDSYFKFRQIREDNDTGGTICVGYEIEIQISSFLRLENIYPKIVPDFESSPIEWVKVRLGTQTDGSEVNHELELNADDGDVEVISYESQTVDDSQLTDIVIKGIFPVDLIDFGKTIFKDFYA